MIFFWTATALLIGYIIYLSHSWLISHALGELRGESDFFITAIGWPILGEIWLLLVAVMMTGGVLIAIGFFWLARKTEKAVLRIKNRQLMAEVSRLKNDVSQQRLSEQKIYSIALADANEQLHQERSVLDQKASELTQKEHKFAGEWEKARKILVESQEAVRVARENADEQEHRKKNATHQARRLQKKVHRLEKELAEIKAEHLKLV